MSPSAEDTAGALPFRVRAFARTRIWVEQIARLSDALNQAVWLGLLDADGIQQLTNHHYRTTKSGGTRDHNYFSEAFNRRGLFAWETEALDAHFADCRSIMVASSGGGREVLGLSKRGFDVQAFECNPALLESSRAFLASEGVTASVFAAKPSEVPEAVAIHDGAIVGWGAYIHIIGRNQRIAFLRGLLAHIRPGGPLLLSFFVYTPSRSRRLVYRLASVLRTLRGGDPIEPGDSLGHSFDHFFTEDEIRLELTAAGFDVVSYSATTRFGHAVAKARPVPA